MSILIRYLNWILSMWRSRASTTHDGAFHPVSTAESSHHEEEAHSSSLYPGSCSFNHDLYLIIKCRNVDGPVNPELNFRLSFFFTAPHQESTCITADEAQQVLWLETVFFAGEKQIDIWQILNRVQVLRFSESQWTKYNKENNQCQTYIQLNAL